MDGCTVLLVDDESNFREVVAKRLRKRRFNLFSVDTGREALRIVAEHGVDVVVLDVRMPDMDGIETLRRIKEADPTLEVILLSGHANADVAMRGMALGAFDYLMKPADIDTLMARVQDAHRRRCLAKAQAAGGQSR